MYVLCYLREYKYFIIVCFTLNRKESMVFSFYKYYTRNQMEADNSKKAEIAIFFIFTYGWSLICGITIYSGIFEDVYNISLFMMLTPATGVALAKIRSSNKEREEKQIYKIVIIAFCMTLFALLFRITGIISDPLLKCFIIVGNNILSIIIVLVAWMSCPRLDPSKNIKVGVKYMLIYLVITHIIIICMNFGGISFFTFSAPFLSIISFPTQCIFTFGEEYGWRGYLQPLLQRRFGKRLGVILVGILWQIWHIPFYYPIENWNWIVQLSRFIYLPALSVAFGYVYMKTKNIWLISFMHYMTNVILAFLPDYKDIRYLPGIIILSCILFSLLFTKEYKLK